MPCTCPAGKICLDEAACVMCLTDLDCDPNAPNEPNRPNPFCGPQSHNCGPSCFTNADCVFHTGNSMAICNQGTCVLPPPDAGLPDARPRPDAMPIPGGPDATFADASPIDAPPVPDATFADASPPGTPDSMVVVVVPDATPPGAPDAKPVPDAAAPPDSKIALDAGAPASPDANTGMNNTDKGQVKGGGLSCAVGGHDAPAGAAWTLLLGAAVLLSRRRRRN
jgi:MYXO-CTERM domain-containing protein